MTSAALADCHGAISDSASKARTKRTVFMKATPAQGLQGFQHQPETKYRPRMKLLRQRFCCAAKRTAGRNHTAELARTGGSAIGSSKRGSAPMYRPTGV